MNSFLFLHHHLYGVKLGFLHLRRRKLQKMEKKVDIEGGLTEGEDDRNRRNLQKLRRLIDAFYLFVELRRLSPSSTFLFAWSFGVDETFGSISKYTIKGKKF